MKKLVAILFTLSLLFSAGCQSRVEPELLTWTKNGDDKVSYIYYEDGHYVAYYFVQGKLVSKERLDK